MGNVDIAQQNIVVVFQSVLSFTGGSVIYL